MSKKWVVTEDFVDFDKVTVRAGTVIDTLVSRGYPSRGSKPFWNGITDGRVMFVTVGMPHYIAPMGDA